MHGVHIYFREERGRELNDRRDENLSSFSDLTYVAGEDEPSDIVSHVRPPVAFRE
jgi:hypothetical protein